MNVISFSLWGTAPKYLIGALRNADIAKEVYPDFQCWFYIHKPSVPQKIVQELYNKSNVKIIFKTGNITTSKPETWRFEPIDDHHVNIMISRDTDTRILQREVLAVREWLESDKIFHIMRDHPYHKDFILAGMFGTRKIKEIPSWKDMINKYNNNISRKGYDQSFLRTFIYPKVVNHSMIHASFGAIEPHAKPFPIPYDDEYRFVGEYVYADESRTISHINILKQHVNP